MKRRLKLTAALTAALALGAGVASAASSPTVSTGGTTKVTETTAELLGTVNPNGATTGYQFRYGLTNSYGSTTRVKTLHGTKPVSVHSDLSHLLPGTTYHYQIAALSSAGGALGADRTFKTAGNPPPGATTGQATNIERSSALLTGVVNPNGQSTDYYFRYGATTQYTQQTIPATVAAGSAPVTVSQPLTLLEPGTIIHYQLVAVNRGITEAGADETFMTLPKPTPKPRIFARTRPGRDRTRPYEFITSGRIRGPRFIPAQYACSGTVTIKFKLGRRTVASTPAPVQPNCTFSAQTVFGRLPGHGSKHRHVDLSVSVRFGGDGYLAARSARTEHVTLG
jgi:hypothetical protein